MSRDKQILGMARVIYEHTAISCVKTALMLATQEALELSYITTAPRIIFLVQATKSHSL